MLESYHRPYVFVQHDLVNQNGSVDFVNAGTLELIASIPVGSDPSGISLNMEGTQALVTDSTSMSVNILDSAAQSVMVTVLVGGISTGSVFLN
jgi:DNA-binding beta-propeller fold protein YncE